MDRCAEGPGLLRVRGQLPDRCAVRCNRGCRGLTCRAPGRDRRRADHAGALRPQTAAARRRSRWLVEEKRIAPHIPVIDKSKRGDGSFSREVFRYDEPTDTYVCPTLTTSGTLVNDGITLLYRGSTRDC